jgi:DNA invertase Pin-like site-specific DNA recombinase
MRKSTTRKRTNGKALIRCAVYTRKSSEEGLEQDFNSLDAQREACEAFILSQKHEGWTALPEMYDDGGISGGTLERPALKRVLADIEAHRIDTVVVYKVDRLTRSLSDFAKIVEIFDKRNVSFVSVTQQFNTTTSMGRLTLNMLLSFAQFEREVTGERIRDKIAASKKKGMWMGGNVPLGYVVKDRKLLIDQAEARTVRNIYRRYATLGSVWTLKEELDRDGIVSKVRVDRYGRATGGNPLARGALYTMLRNRIYRGQIVHKDKHYPGEHEAIVDEALWDEVQRKLAANRIDRATSAHAAEPSLLAGLIYDDSGRRMTPSHANKKGTRYRYYVSQALVSGNRRSAPRARRVPAGEVERLVEERLTAFLKNQGEVFDAVEPLSDDVNKRQEVVDLAADLAARWPDLAPTTKRQICERLVNRIDLTQETLEIRIAPGRLLEILWEADNPITFEPALWDNELTITFTVPAHLKRAGMETRLVIEGADGSARKSPDRSLLRLLSQAHRFHEMVMHNRGRTMAELAIEAGVGGSYFTRILRLSFLAPDVVKAILRDRHPLELTAKKLAGDTRLPIAWEEQRARLGIA